MSLSTAARPAPPNGPWRRRKACENCRRRKEKCDGLQPCGRCRMRQVEGECPRRHESSYIRQSQGKKNSTSSSGGSDTTTFPDASQGGITSPTLPTVSVASSLPSSARLVRKRDGEYVFIGPSSNLSVLQSIRQIVFRALGSCPFTDESIEPDFIDDEDSLVPPVNWPAANVQPPRPSVADARYYLRWYASATSCVFDLFSYEELVTEIIPWVEQPAVTTADATRRNCVNFLVLAIGAQCGPQDRDAEAQAYFTYGRYLAVTQFLDAPSIRTVQISCLITMYLLNSSRRTAASMQLGGAIRTAYSLGIHLADVSALFPAAENANRERVWKVIRVLDLFLNTSLGQQPATSETRDTMSQKEYSASTDLCYIFEKILLEIYTKQDVSTSVLQHVSKHHREWAGHFHEGLRVDRIPSEEYFGVDQGGKKLPNIGLYHLKEAYYWTIMLVTRPYLMDLVQRCIANLTNHTDPFPAAADCQSDTLLAHASVNSAVLTIDLLQGLMRADEIPRRMPYVVNSVFISALVLGMGFFADLDRLFPLGQALMKAEQLLERFQSHDALAKWSLGIVHSLRDACNEFVKRRYDRWLKHQRSLVEGLFGDVKSAEVRPSRPPSPPNNNLLPIPMGHEESSPENEDTTMDGDTESSQLASNDLQLDGEENNFSNNIIWGQLFWNGSPSQLGEPDIELAGLPTNWL